MWRSARIQGRSARGSEGAGAALRRRRPDRPVDPLEVGAERPEALRLGPAARFGALPLPPRLVLRQALQRGADELRLARGLRRVDDGDAGGARLEPETGLRRSAGTKPAAPRSSSAREAASRADRTVTRSRTERGTYGRALSGRVSNTTASQPGRALSALSAARPRNASSDRHSTTKRRRGAPDASLSVSTPSGTTS